MRRKALHITEEHACPLFSKSVEAKCWRQRKSKSHLFHRLLAFPLLAGSFGICCFSTFCVLYFKHSRYSYGLHCVSSCFNEPFNCFICQYLTYERKYGSWTYGGYRASQSTINLGNSLFRPLLITAGNILCGISWRWRKVMLSKLDLENAFVCNLFFFYLPI